MLKTVHVKNLALIKESEFDLGSGLNVMTGETGSGKSIIIGAVNIALGAKANKSMIRTGADHALVELQFIHPDERVLKALSELDIPSEEEGLIITRRITRDSSISKINGETVTLSSLRRITSLLVDVHGQHEHQSLLDPSKHLEILDGFIGEEALQLRAELRRELEHYKDMRREFLSFDLDEASLQRETELLTHELNEILAAELSDGEDEALESEYRKLSASGQILKAAGRALSDLEDEENGVLTKVQDGIRQLEEVLSLDEDLKEIRAMMTDLDSVARDLSASLSHYIDSHQFDGERYHAVRTRLDVINHLKSRFGNSLPEISRHAEEVSAKLEKYAGYAQEKEALSVKLKESARELNVIAKRLSEIRREGAERLAPMIRRNLQDLNFTEVRFEIDFQKTEKISANGFDRVEFLICANRGEEPKPLAKVASGGELSRIMLALKSSAADQDRIPTLIFDEIDTGISGFTAQKVGEKLRLLSSGHQIICITHLPQIAAMADHHFQIHKEFEDGSTISGIEELSEEEMTAEIARLVGGAEITEAALMNARELKAAAGKLR